jgi:competence protein ComEC
LTEFQDFPTLTDKIAPRRAAMVSLLKRSGLPLLLLGFAAPVSAQTVDITVIDVGQGDSTLIEFPASDTTGDRKRMLIDGGPGSDAVVQTLLDKGITHLDIVMLTHPHKDHYGGLTGLLNETNPDGSHTFTVDEFWWSGEGRGEARNESPPTTWTAFEGARARIGASHVVQQGEEHKYQKARIVFLNSGGGYDDTPDGPNINNDSIVMMLYYKRVKMLFAGDIEGAEGRGLANDYCRPNRSTCKKLNCKIMKIPHHGSGHFSPRFVRLSDPEHILISAGFTNRQFHHPRETTLLAYEENTGAERFYSTSMDLAKGNNNIGVIIGPGRGDFRNSPSYQ